MFNPEPYNKDWHIAELIQDKDFDGDQWFADDFYRRHEVMPYIFFDLLPRNATPGRNIKEIRIVFAKNYGSDIIVLLYKPFELFLSLFWDKIWQDSAKEDRLLAKEGFLYERFINNLGGRKEYSRADFIPQIYDISDFIRYIENIWNECCLFEGNASISRHSFCLWLYRLHCIIYDLFEHPYLSDKNWLKRCELIRLFLEDKFSREYEYFESKRWHRAIGAKKQFDKTLAFQQRIKDAKSLLNDFFTQVKPESALGGFLIDYFASFGEELVNRKFIIKCGFCGEYIDFIKGKKYCSLLGEGKDCGKSARNKRYYSTKGKERLPKYRQTTKELRALYKEKGIKK